jgi:hypothetical protein
MRFFAGPILLVIDELGYLPLPAEAASAMFQVAAQGYTKPHHPDHQPRRRLHHHPPAGGAPRAPGRQSDRYDETGSTLIHKYVQHDVTGFSAPTGKLVFRGFLVL